MFSGAAAHLIRTVPGLPGWADEPSIRASFLPSGQLDATYTDFTGSFEGKEQGAWSVEGNKLCTKWTSWDGGVKNCYSISGKDPSYTASGPEGILRGNFRLSK